MVENIMIDPSHIFVTEDVWNKIESQDEYLENLIELFREIGNNSQLKILWSFELESLLWEDSKYRPWSEMSSSKNKLVPILYKFFNDNANYINGNELTLSRVPKFQISDENIIREYGKISDIQINGGIKFNLFTQINDNKFVSSKNITFYSEILKTVLCLMKIDLKSRLFDNCNFSYDKYLELYCRINNIKLRNKFSFSQSFINKMKKLTDSDILELTEKLTMRLAYNSTEARKCKDLQEEYITSNSINEFRIRITQRPTSKRVHFVIDNNIIIFKKYYGIGEHDDGL